MKRGPKETRKDGCKKKISSMKDKNGERTTDREETLNICKTYYEELYDKSVHDPDHLLSSSPDNTEVPPFTEEEVEASLKKMSKRKAPGPDDITSDMFLLGGEPVTKKFNEILTTTQIPTTWDEAKAIIIYKKGDPGDIKKLQNNQPPVSLLQIIYTAPTNKNGKHFGSEPTKRPSRSYSHLSYLSIVHTSPVSPLQTKASSAHILEHYSSTALLSAKHNQ